MAKARVLVQVPPYPLDVVRQLLAGAAMRVEVASPPWSGGDVAGLLTWDRVGADDFDRLPNLRVVATCSVGYDHIDLAAAEKRGVWVCNVPDYCIEEMADSTVALTLALLRGVVALDRTVRAGEWDDHAAGVLMRVAGTRLGVVGFGRIGRAVAGRAKAMGMEVWAVDPLVGADSMVAAGVKPSSLDQMLAACSVVSLHVPLTTQTTRLIGERELSLMPRGAYLVNTARASLVDQPALLAALESGALGGAALDVLEVEPPSVEHPAPVHPRLIVTPHSAWYTADSEREVYRRAALSVRAVLDGKEPAGVVVRGR